MIKRLLIMVSVILLMALAGCQNNGSDQGTDAADRSDSTDKTTQAPEQGKETPDATPTSEVEATTAPTTAPTQVPMEPTVVYMTKDISPEGLVKIYEALGREASGKVAVKIHMGEPGGNNYLKPDLVKDLVLSVNGTFVDCNTAYGGNRANTAAHMQAAEDHGFTEYTSVDILDADGSMSLPVTNGKHIEEDLVGDHFADYDFYIVLSHFKGHEMGGFGGALKNMSIGFASREGKNYIHTAGSSKTTMWINTNQDYFLESMAEAAKAVADAAGENILYINVMNNISIDCDCNPRPAAPEMADIGILASLDPVALDKACVDLVYAAPEEESAKLRARMESLNAEHILVYGEEIGLGTQNYNLVMIDD